eukprot:TRINITY_DN45749_c0_g1_i1.p1 TRINITY_DN45749_c0_g1~~TRINITY_DN45749_c0_g1_i1.p1  ORF type:complete len:429 (-),score=110.87 TRINITY_DN45749_c0_g1_i1:400-1686(-)
MNNYGVDISGCPGPPHLMLNTRTKHTGQAFMQAKPEQPRKQAMLSAKELTGAPLISYVPKNRKLKKKISEPLEKERISNFSARQRHSSEQSLTHLLSSAPVPSYYLGQNLYHKLLADQGLVYLQDFYRNPAFTILQRQTVTSTIHHQNINMRKENISKSFDNLSDTFSMSSDESDNFIPRIIRPRRRRKKEKKRTVAVSVSEQEESCLGSEKQWLPTGLLSAESSFDSRSESGSSEEEAPPVHQRRKLAPTLSVPAYSSYRYNQYNTLPADRSLGSDYSSMTSTSSDTPFTSPPSSSNDHLFDSDSGSTKSVPENNQSVDQLPIGSTAQNSGHQPLKMTKSTSCSYFRSPKVAQKGVNFKKDTTDHHRSIPLRKTNSWAFTTSSTNDAASPRSEGGEFSLFSPGRSIDLLSGIRKHLSRLDLQDELEN